MGQRNRQLEAERDAARAANQGLDRDAKAAYANEQKAKETNQVLLALVATHAAQPTRDMTQREKELLIKAIERCVHCSTTRAHALTRAEHNSASHTPPIPPYKPASNFCLL